MARIVKDSANTSVTPTRTDEQVLVPDVTIEINGEIITVRELRFNDHIQYAHLITPIKQAFDQLALKSDDELTDRVIDILFSNGEESKQLLAFCCDKTPEWVGELTARNMDLLIDAWWGANSSFFINRLIRRGLLKELIRAARIANPTG